MNVFACADSFLPCLVVITSQGEFFLTLKTLWFAEEETCSGKLAATAFSIHTLQKDNTLLYTILHYLPTLNLAMVPFTTFRF